MSITTSNESQSRIRSWFQFSSKSNSNSSSNSNSNTITNASNSCNTRSDDENVKDSELSVGQQQSNTLLERVTSFRRSLTKAQHKKHKIRFNSNLFSYYLFIFFSEILLFN
jgi:type IV secretory pathway VirB4 component